MKKTMVVALLTALVLTGCGSKAEEAQAEPSSEETAVSGEETTADAVEGSEDAQAAAEGVTLDAIKEAGVLHVGTDLTFEPYEYLDDDENPVGYDVEIWQRVADELGVELQLEDLSFSGIFAGLEAGKFDAAACCCNVTAERMEKYLFCYPVAFDEFYLVKRADDASISSVEEANGKIAGVKLGTAPATALEEFSATLADGIAEKDYDSSTSAFLDLTNGNIDLACESYTICKQQVDASNGALEIVGSISTPVYCSFAFRQADSELADFVSGVIKQMKDEGALEELQIKYFGVTFDDLPENPAEYIK